MSPAVGTIRGRRQQRRAAQIAVSGAHRRPQIDIAVFAGTKRLCRPVQDADLGVPEAPATLPGGSATRRRATP